MNKKTFDIIPPNEARTKAESAPVSFKPSKRLGAASPLFTHRKNKLPFILIFSGIALLFFLGYFLIEPKAEIDIWPKMAAATFETRAEIAGQELVTEEAVSREFVATGSAEKKNRAEGTITVYNNYHLEQILIQNTRFWCFEDDELREFKTKERVTIPPGSSLEVEVAASSPGEEYNIAPCTFSVPGLKGSPRYTAVYGESSSPMTGGEIAGVARVTSEDLGYAKEILTQEAFKKSKNSLESLLASGDYISAEGGTLQKIIESGSPAELAEELEKFLYEVKAQTKSLALKRSELEKFAKEYALLQLPEGREIQESSLELAYPTPKADLKNGKISLDLKITVNVYSSISEASLKEQVKGKKLGQIQQSFGGFPEIEKVRVRLWPFWVTRAPEEADRVDIKINI